MHPLNYFSSPCAVFSHIYTCLVVINGSILHTEAHFSKTKKEHYSRAFTLGGYIFIEKFHSWMGTRAREAHILRFAGSYADKLNYNVWLRQNVIFFASHRYSFYVIIINQLHSLSARTKDIDYCSSIYAYNKTRCVIRLCKQSPLFFHEGLHTHTHGPKFHARIQLIPSELQDDNRESAGEQHSRVWHKIAYACVYRYQD